jgi:SAM-dependent methyltransferase
VPYFRDEDARSIIRTTYESAAPAGRDVAQGLYAADELAGLAEGPIRWAFGVGNPVRHAGLRPGDVVLDVGCGAGLDTLLAARRVAPDGRVVAIDMTPAMLDRARRHAASMRIENVEWHEAFMEALPLPDAAVDVVLCNGVLNLSTRKSRALAEMRRVLRPGGRLALADLVLTESLPEEIQRDAVALAV